MISYEIGYTTEWLCDFHMEWFPFDTQSCIMEFLQQDHSVILVPDKVMYSGGDLPKHFIRNLTICSFSKDGQQGVIVEIVLGRPIFSSFLTVRPPNKLHLKIDEQVTLPTGMLMFLSQMINMFPKQFLTMVIQVNLTVMLVLATLKVDPS